MFCSVDIWMLSNHYKVSALNIVADISKTERYSPHGITMLLAHLAKLAVIPSIHTHACPFQQNRAPATQYPQTQDQDMHGQSHGQSHRQSGTKYPKGYQLELPKSCPLQLWFVQRPGVGWTGAPQLRCGELARGLGTEEAEGNVSQ